MTTLTLASTVALCVANVFPFTVEAEPVKVLLGNPIIIEATLIYTGKETFYIPSACFQQPFIITLPKEWNPTRTAQSMIFLNAGFDRAMISPGERMDRIVDPQYHFDFTPTLGWSVIKITPIITVINDRRDRIGCMRGKPISVPVWVGKQIVEK